jgi:hypothetical protein
MLTGFPSPHDDDSEDVAWGLTTGSALWKQGERYDAIVWLKRAVDAATEAGHSTRADELNRAATDLIASLAAPAPAPLAPPQAAPPPPAPLAPLAPAPAPLAPSAPPPDRQIAPKSPVPPPPSGSPPQPPPVPARKGPTPPKPPPPPRSRSSASKLELPPPRAQMPSVTTSAPPLEELTSHPPAREVPHDAPPPPTITPEVDVRPEPEPEPAHEHEHETAPAHEHEHETAAAHEHEPADAPELVAPPEPLAEPELEAPFFLGALEASGELTDAQRRELFRSVTVQSISADEELKVTGLALVIDGVVSVQATVSDVAAGTLKAGEALYAKCSIPDAMSLRLVAEADPTKVAIWDLDAIEAALAGSSTLIEGLMQASNRIQAIAGCTMGPLGDRLDEGLRTSAIERLEVRVLQPDEIVASAGLPVPGMIIVGIGTVELERGDRLGPGDFLFATEVLGGESAPSTARAGAKGAIIFFGARALAQELLVSCPPLLEIFAGM